MRFDGSEIGPTEANNEGEQKIPGRHRRAGSDLPLSRGDAGDKRCRAVTLPGTARLVTRAQRREEPGLQLAGRLPAGGVSALGMGELGQCWVPALVSREGAQAVGRQRRRFARHQRSPTAASCEEAARSRRGSAHPAVPQRPVTPFSPALESARAINGRGSKM